MIQKYMRVLFILLTGVVFSLRTPAMVFAAQEDQFSPKLIRLIIGGGAGTSIDSMMRTLSKAAEKFLGQPIVCSNPEEVSGILALGAVINEKPDEYALVTVTTGVVMAGVVEEVNFDIPNDFDPVINAQ